MGNVKNQKKILEIHSIEELKKILQEQEEDTMLTITVEVLSDES